jgi:Hypothetical glycosyl hydrolase family 15
LPTGRRIARLHVTLALGLALAGALVLGTPASAVPPSTSDVHLWAFGSVSNTVDAVAVAKRSDIVIGPAGAYDDFRTLMHTAHPGIVIAPYRNAISVGGGNFLFIKQNHPSWLLRDAAGNLMQDSFGAYLINPADPGVRQWHANAALASQAAGWDAIYLDCLGTYGLEAFGGTPIDPSTGKPYTVKSWLAATRGLAIIVRNAVRVPVIGNGMRDGSTYWSGNNVLVDGIDAGVFEGCFRGATEPIDDWPTLAEWNLHLSALSDLQARGRWALCMTKAWTATTSAQQRRWHDFALASFLLVSRSNAYFVFSGAKGDMPLTSWGEESLKIGSPTTGRIQQGRAYLRRFTTGISLVNPSGTGMTVALGGTYRLPSGQRVTTVFMPAHTGKVLLAA